MCASKRLLILGCSESKISSFAEISAVQRYDGPLYKIVRKYLREHPDKEGQLDIYIVSAKFGLISKNTRIPNYDMRMTASVAGIWRSSILDTLRDLMHSGGYSHIFVCMGKVYLQAVEGYTALIPIEVNHQLADGSMGRRQSQLLAWLNGQASNTKLEQPERHSIDQEMYSQWKHSAKVKGIDLKLSPSEIVEIARQKLQLDYEAATACHSWGVPIDGIDVAPKWLVSQLTGLGVSEFHTGTARRVLEQLGLQVLRK